MTDLSRLRQPGGPRGIVSVCSAHPTVIRVALAGAARVGQPVLIEATCNQVNQEGGYTGLTPAGFRHRVEGLAAAAGVDPARLLLGGDHLGPNPWRRLPGPEAMLRAGAMVAAYVRAGFTKLHLDCSMGCAGEPEAVGDALAALRAAALAERAEAEARAAGLPPPVYVIGTEVPVPGGADHPLDSLAVTTPAAVAATHAAHRAAFAVRGLDDAFGRAIALVVQPGVEFGQHAVAAYVPEAARALSESLATLPGLVYEAHSTDYQPDQALADLVRDGFAILKVGPALTFALRRALYALAGLDAAHGAGEALPAVMERLMQANPVHWARHCATWADRHEGLSDRIRYYWPEPEAEAAVTALLDRLGTRDLPLAPTLDLPCGAAGEAHATARIEASVAAVLAPYFAACAGEG